jgi:hypothetical protein
MFKSQQYRAKAAEYGELVKRSTGSDESSQRQNATLRSTCARGDHLVSIFGCRAAIQARLRSRDFSVELRTIAV